MFEPIVLRRVSPLGVSVFWVSLVLTLAGVLATSHAAELATGDKKKVTVDKGKVYLGSPSNFKKAGVIRLGQVFKNLEPYKQIKRENLERSDPKYRVLLVQANDLAKAAMTRVRDSEGYDLIVETGHITIEGESVDDITQKVIDAL